MRHVWRHPHVVARRSSPAGPAIRCPDRGRRTPGGPTPRKCPFPSRRDDGRRTRPPAAPRSGPSTAPRRRPGRRIWRPSGSSRRSAQWRRTGNLPGSGAGSWAQRTARSLTNRNCRYPVGYSCNGATGVGRAHGRAGRRTRPPAHAARRRRGGPLGGRPGQRGRRGRQDPAGQRGDPARRGTRLHRALRPVRRAGRQRALPAAGRRAARRRPVHRGPRRAQLAAGPEPAAARKAATGSAPTKTVPAWPGSRCSARVLGLLTELAAATPVLLVLEDLHWADASTRDLVTFLSRMLHRERVALIGTYRTDDLHRRHPLRPVVAELLRLPSVTAVDLAPLTPSALAEHLTRLAEHLMAAAPGRIEATELNDIVARAEGNAYYAEELLAAFVGGDPAEAEPARRAGGAAAQPGGAAVRCRAAGAPRGGGGRPPGRRRAGPAPRPGLAAAEYEAAVREAVTHQLLVPDGTEGYVFRHALLREAVYARPAAGRADQAARHDERAAGRGAAARDAGNGRRAGPALPGQPRHLRARSPPPSGPARRRSGSARRPRRTGTTTRRSPCGSGWPSRRRRPAWPAAKLGLLSATNAADSGDVDRAVHLLRRLRQALAARPRGARGCQPGQPDRRAARLLPDADRRRQGRAEAVEIARATVDATPAEPPTW